MFLSLSSYWHSKNAWPNTHSCVQRLVVTFILSSYLVHRSRVRLFLRDPFLEYGFYYSGISSRLDPDHVRHIDGKTTQPQTKMIAAVKNRRKVNPQSKSFVFSQFGQQTTSVSQHTYLHDLQGPVVNVLHFRAPGLLFRVRVAFASTG